MTRSLVLVASLALLAARPARADEPAAAQTGPGTSTPAPAATPGGTPALVVFRDGQQLRGRLVARDESGITLELEGGGRIVIPATAILRVDLARPGQAEVHSPDPNRTRYLYSPTGFMLKGGEGYLSQTELLLTSVYYGVTDHLTIGLGTAVPFLFVKDGANLTGTLRVGGSVGEYVHLAAGVQGFWLPGVEAGTTAGFLFGTVTLGTPDLNLGVSAGPPFVAGTAGNDVGRVLVSVSGNARLSEHVALVTENWLAPSSSTGYALGFAVRFIGQRLGVDAGLVFVEGAQVPLPWLDFTWHFR
jgi:hypothetical protein